MNQQAPVPPIRTTQQSGEPLLIAPILPTLLRLTMPTTVAMVATALAAIAETTYVGLLGTEALAAMALVFPMVMLMQMMSAGAMGGGVSSAVARALGAGDVARANMLALHALAIAVGFAMVFTVVFLAFGAQIYHLLGGHGAAYELALLYSGTAFTGAIAVWLFNTLASVLRGTGNMMIPSVLTLAVAILQIAVGGTLGLGLGPVPRLGIAGVAMGAVIAFGSGAVFLLWYLCSGRGRLRLRFPAFVPQWPVFADILKVGAVACLSPIQSVLTVLIFTGLVARFGTTALAGYGIGARLEFLLVPIAFSVGVACLPMVGMAVGAGQIGRARRVAWTAGTVAAVTLGAIGLVVVVAPDLWSRLFTADEAVIAAARQYLTAAGAGFPFFGLGLCLYFASQGAGHIVGPVLTATLRLAVVALGGWWLTGTEAPVWTLFALAGVAMTAYGLSTLAVVYRTRWER